MLLRFCRSFSYFQCCNFNLYFFSMKIKLATSLIFLFSLTSLAQQLSISGHVNDVNKQPVAFCNVTLTEILNKTSLSGTTTNEEGDFMFENLKPVDYLLNISFLGFESYQDTISLKKSVSIGNIILKEETQKLESVTVIAKRPTVKRLVDRLVFNVENSTLSNNNILDVLKNTPGVFVYDGVISIKNSTPTVYINDRKVHLSANEIQQLLEGSSASNIKSIEVITSPPAKYEAEGGSVLNIIMSKSLLPGYNGSIFGTFKQGEKYPKYSLGTSHFFKSEKIDAYVNYNLSPRKDYRHNSETINFIENNQKTSGWETDFQRTKTSSNHTLNSNIDFKINDYNTLGFSTNILVSLKDNTTTDVESVTEVFSSIHTLDSIFKTNNHIDDQLTNLAFTLDYTHQFKKEGEKLSLSAHHTNYNYSSDQLVNTDYFFADRITLIRNNEFQTVSDQKIALYTGQIDYELPISETSLFEMGAKLSSIDSESQLIQYNYENSQPLLDTNNSDTFLYDELNYAGYVSYSKDWETWSIKGGLRTEYTDRTGYSLSVNVVNKANYIKVFPSFYISNSLNDNNELYFNYIKRIYRPGYSKLNPFKYYLNDNTYSTGNPDLLPEIDDVLTLGYTFNKKYTFEAYYRYETNPTLQITFQDNTENILKIINTNIDRNISYGLDFTTYTKIVDNWNLSVFSSLFYTEGQFIAEESNNAVLVKDKWSFIGQIINYFSFLKDKSLTADMSYLYIAPIVDGPSVYSSRHGLDMTLKKTLWKEKGSLSIGVTDIFNTQNFTQTNKYLNQDLFLKSRLENRLVTVGFNYKFGNTRLQTNEKAIDLEERDRLNNKSN